MIHLREQLQATSDTTTCFDVVLSEKKFTKDCHKRFTESEGGRAGKEEVMFSKFDEN